MANDYLIISDELVWPLACNKSSCSVRDTNSYLLCAMWKEIGKHSMKLQYSLNCAWPTSQFRPTSLIWKQSRCLKGMIRSCLKTQTLDKFIIFSHKHKQSIKGVLCFNLWWSNLSSHFNRFVCVSLFFDFNNLFTMDDVKAMSNFSSTIYALSDQQQQKSFFIQLPNK